MVDAVANTKNQVSDEFLPTIDASGPTPSDMRTPLLPAVTTRGDGSLPTVTRYEDGALLGEGGMGEVQLLRDVWIGREIARKRLHKHVNASDTTQARFLREARVQGQLEHPAIVPVYDMGIASNGELFFTMRRVRGRTLSSVLTALARRDPAITEKFSRRKLLSAFVNVCLAIHYAHTRGVVHRDLKPDNIMLGDFGEVYVLDWGIAKVAGAADIQGESGPGAGASLTRAGAVVGTPAYMPPEQLRADTEKVTARSDVYSLGLILFEILTNERAHAGTTPAEVFVSTFETVEARPSLRLGQIPPELDDACARATRADPDERFPTARELASAVERFLDGDRDLERRRVLADEHAERAAAATERALSPDVGESESQDNRAAAMTSVMQALALDTANATAKRTLVRLLVEEGSHLPAEARKAMADATVRTTLNAVQGGLVVYATWFLTFIVLWWMGIRDVRPIAAGFVAWLLGASTLAYVTRLRRVPDWTVIVFALVNYTLVDLSACWLGPFVLVPTAVAISMVTFVQLAEPRLRLTMMVLGVLAALAPFAIEFAHVVAPAWQFVDGGVILFERAIRITPGRTLPVLMWVCGSFAIMPAIYFMRMRDSLRRAEQKLFLQAWHLERLTATAERPAA